MATPLPADEFDVVERGRRLGGRDSDKIVDRVFHRAVPSARHRDAVEIEQAVEAWAGHVPCGGDEGVWRACRLIPLL